MGSSSSRAPPESCINISPLKSHGTTPKRNIPKYKVKLDRDRLGTEMDTDMKTIARSS